MKRKVLLTMLCLAISIPIVACGTENTAEQQEVIATEQTAETEIIEEPTKQETEMFGLDDIDNTSSSSETTSSESSGTTRTDYPDSNPEHRKAWNNFCENWNESDYGTTTAGKCMNDFPYYGDTGYDPKGTILQYRTTDKGYTVMYDTETGRVYYTGMTLPTGNSWDDITSGGVLASYEMSKGYNGFYDVTYAEMQEVLGVYNGD